MRRILATVIVFSLGAYHLVAQSPSDPVPIGPSFSSPSNPVLPIQPLPPAENPFSLPDGPNAFNQRSMRPLQGWWFDAGTVSYQRGYLSQQAITFLHPPDPIGFVTQTTTVSIPITFKQGKGKGAGEIMQGTATVTATFTSPVFQETAATAPAGSPIFGNYNDMPFSMEWGPKLALGYRTDRFALELNGSYIPGHTSQIVLVSPPIALASLLTIQGAPTININPGATLISIDGSIPDALAANLPPPAVGQLNLPFINAPVGFEGNQGLWTQADRVAITHKTSLGDVELLGRVWPVRGSPFQFHIGARYMDLRESMSILTQDDIITAIPDAKKEATYAIDVRNRILAGQLGCEVEIPAFALLSFSAYAKGAWGANFLEFNTALTRGDGMVGFNDQRSRVGFSHLYEMGLSFDARIIENVHLIGGYKAFWLVNVAEASNQIEYDLSRRTGRNDNRGGVFFQGLFFNLQCRF